MQKITCQKFYCKFSYCFFTLPHPRQKVDVQGSHAPWKAWRMKKLINTGLKVHLNKSSLIQLSDFIFFIGQPHLQETDTTSRGSQLNEISCKILHLFFPASRSKNFSWYLLIKTVANVSIVR